MVFRLKKGDLIDILAPGSFVDKEENFHEKMRPFGGSVNANTRFESTVYETHVPEIYLEQAIQLEADRFLNMKVTTELLTIEKEAVRSEYSTKFDSSPIIDLWFKVYNAAFPGHPFEWMIVGYKADLDAITAEDCNRFYERLYIPNNVGVVIAGNIDVDQTFEWVGNAYKDWVPGTPSELPALTRLDNGYIYSNGRLPSRSKMMLGGYRIPYINQDNVVQLELLNHILFDSSHNLAKLRILDKAKMVSAIDGFNFHYDAGMMKFLANIFPEYSVDDIRGQLKLLRQDFINLPDQTYNAYLREYQIDTAENILANQDLAMAIIYSWGKYGDVAFLGSLVRNEITVPKEALIDMFDLVIQDKNLVVVESPADTK